MTFDPAPSAVRRAADVPRQRQAGRTGTTVLAVVGTDVHPFDRLLEWLTTWHRARPAAPAMIVQYGHSTPPALPGGVAFLDHTGLQRAMAAAALVVSHGGPATITEARRHGRTPIVVPRDHARGEHVDDHQQRFARRLAAAGVIRLCEDSAALAAALDLGLTDPAAFASDTAAVPAIPPGVARVGEIVDALIARRMTRGRRR